MAGLGQHFLQLTTGRTAHAEHVVLQGMNAVAAAIEFHADGVDQERHIRVQHFHRGVGGLPAVLFIIRVEHLHLRAGRLEILQQTPGRKRAADQIGQSSLGQFFEGDDAKELLSEQTYLWQGLLTDVLCQRGLQLMLEVDFAGCGEERHGATPLLVIRRPEGRGAAETTAQRL